MPKNVLTILLLNLFLKLYAQDICNDLPAQIKLYNQAVQKFNQNHIAYVDELKKQSQQTLSILEPCLKNSMNHISKQDYYEAIFTIGKLKLNLENYQDAKACFQHCMDDTNTRTYLIQKASIYNLSHTMLSYCSVDAPDNYAKNYQTKLIVGFHGKGGSFREIFNDRVFQSELETSLVNLPYTAEELLQLNQTIFSIADSNSAVNYFVEKYGKDYGNFIQNLKSAYPIYQSNRVRLVNELKHFYYADIPEWKRESGDIDSSSFVKKYKEQALENFDGQWSFVNDIKFFRFKADGPFILVFTSADLQLKETDGKDPNGSPDGIPTPNDKGKQKSSQGINNRSTFPVNAKRKQSINGRSNTTADLKSINDVQQFEKSDLIQVESTYGTDEINSKTSIIDTIGTSDLKNFERYRYTGQLRLQNMISAFYHSFSKKFSLKKPQTISPVYIYSSRFDQDGYKEFSDFCKQLHFRTPGYKISYYNPYDNSIVFWSASGEGSLYHEMAHSLLTNDFPNIPNWLNEGVSSMYEESQISSTHNPSFLPLNNWRIYWIQAFYKKFGHHLDIKELLWDNHGQSEISSIVFDCYSRYFSLFLDKKLWIENIYKNFKGSKDRLTERVQQHVLEQLTAKKMESIQTLFNQWLNSILYQMDHLPDDDIESVPDSKQATLRNEPVYVNRASHTFKYKHNAIWENIQIDADKKMSQLTTYPF